MMVMDEPGKRARDHLISKMPRPVEHRDLRGEPLPDAEMPGAPGDGLAEIDQAAGDPGDGRLVTPGHRGLVQIDGAGEIEDSLDGGVDVGDEFQDGHRGGPQGWIQSRMCTAPTESPATMIFPSGVTAQQSRGACVSRVTR